MVGFTEISAALTGLKGAMDIAKGLNAVADAVALNEAKIGLQSAIIDAQASLLAAQEAQSANLRRIAELEQEMVRLKDWSAERECYELTPVRGGGFAYMLKAGMQAGQPAHWLCTNCFEQGHKSIMQNKGQAKPGTGDDIIGCDRCKGSFTVLPRTRPTYDRPG
jgi:hypothetical protein